MVQTVPNCVRIDPSPITGLAQIYQCVVCLTEFFSDKDGVCQPVVDKISNCAEYDTIDTCNRCS